MVVFGKPVHRGRVRASSPKAVVSILWMRTWRRAAVSSFGVRLEVGVYLGGEHRGEQTGLLPWLAHTHKIFMRNLRGLEWCKTLITLFRGLLISLGFPAVGPIELKPRILSSRQSTLFQAPRWSE